jgi:DnaJ-class molecular chaperone
MVCAVCNGKGYVIEKDRELVCNECQGRGEFFFTIAIDTGNRNLKKITKRANSTCRFDAF